MASPINPENDQHSGGLYRQYAPPPMTTYPPHDAQHWTFCYDDYCATHRQSKENYNYFPTAGRKGTNECNCGRTHDPELEAVIRKKHLDVRKACRAWQRGKRVCYDCGFLVNMDGHEARCGATGPARSSTTPAPTPDEPTPVPEKDQQHPNGEQPPTAPELASETSSETLMEKRYVPVYLMSPNRDPERLAINLSFYGPPTGKEEVLPPTHTPPPFEGSSLPEHSSTGFEGDPSRRQRLSGRCRRKNRNHRRQRQPRPRPHGEHQTSLVGVSAWRGELLSRTARDMLLGGIVTTAGLWFVGVTLGMAYVTVRV